MSGDCDADVLNGSFDDLAGLSNQLSAPVDNASYVSSSVPGTVNAGAAFSATVTMNNNGTSTWTNTGSNPYRLVRKAPKTTPPGA